MVKGIKVISTDKSLSASGGLLLAKEALETSALRLMVASSMPKDSFGATRSLDKFEAMILGSMAGAECLDDLERLAEDPAFAETASRCYSAKSFGNFLRAFDTYHCKLLQRSLIRQSLKLRRAAVGEIDSFTLDLDSTSNQQYAKKMEGVETNYKNIQCLDTLKAFDEFGFPYWHDVRPGATHTSSGAPEVIATVFRHLADHSKNPWLKKYLRADSGYCNVDVFNACHTAGVQFVTHMRHNMLEPRIPTIYRWNRQNPEDSARIRIHDGRECEIGETVYLPDGGQQLLRIVCLRAEKRDLSATPLFDDARYDYYAFVTNIPHSEMTAKEIIYFYRKRGNSENFIKEDKYGFDLKHYPCLKLTANKAYGLITAFATAYMRFLSLIAGKKKTQYAKATRHQLIHLPMQIVRHAGQVIFKFCKRHIQEVLNVLNKITSQQFGINKQSPQSCGGRSLTIE